MLVREDFAERVAALSSSTPRAAIANLLSALLPRVAAKTRAPDYGTPGAIKASDKPRWDCKGTPNKDGVDWSKPLMAVNKRTGELVPVSYKGFSVRGYRETTRSPARDSNEIWLEDGSDRCTNDRWFIRNVGKPLPEERENTEATERAKADLKEPFWEGVEKTQQRLGKGRTPKTRKALPTGQLQSLVKNPKRGASAKRYDQYRVGHSAAWHVQNTDMTASDIVWDVEHGFTKWA